MHFPYQPGEVRMMEGHRGVLIGRSGGRMSDGAATRRSQFTGPFFFRKWSGRELEFCGPTLSTAATGRCKINFNHLQSSLAANANVCMHPVSGTFLALNGPLLLRLCPPNASNVISHIPVSLLLQHVIYGHFRLVTARTSDGVLPFPLRG